MTSHFLSDFSTQPELTGDRWTTFDQLPDAQRGPVPYPSWLVTSGWAQDTELGILKTGKEADVFLLERATEQAQCLLAAKRYRSREHSLFRRADIYLAHRTAPDARTHRAIAKGTSFGRQAAQSMWARYEWNQLVSLWSSGFSVPYPVSFDGSEILMEYIGTPTQAAPRLTTLTEQDVDVTDLWEQFREFVFALAARHLAHSDLSPYNILVHDGRLVIIDWPQCVDVITNPAGMDLLFRDLDNVCRWFIQCGLEVDAGELFGEVMSYI